MVWETKQVERSDGIKINVKHHLNCKDSGVYAAQCLTCRELYVGQTINRFNTRWNGHRNVWKEMTMTNQNSFQDAEDNNLNDKKALAAHYLKNTNVYWETKLKDCRMHTESHF